jgi:PqqD family protein of HPr-rel-A system
MKLAEPPDVRFSAVQGLRAHAYDDEAVVFDPLSWDAHLLNPAAMAVLELLLESPRSEGEITAFLASALHSTEQTNATEHAQRLIGELQSLGLVHHVEGTPVANR